MLTMLFLQQGLAPHIQAGGVSPDLLLLVALVGGMVGGAERGAVIGFVAGIEMDLIVLTPFGLWALTGCLAGWAVGQLHTTFSQGGVVLHLLTAVAASAAALTLFISLALLIGQEFLNELPLVRIVVTVSIINGLLTPIGVRWMRWALEGIDELGARS